MLSQVKAEDNAATAEQQGAVKSEAGHQPEDQDETDSEPDSDEDDDYEVHSLLHNRSHSLVMVVTGSCCKSD